MGESHIVVEKGVFSRLGGVDSERLAYRFSRLNVI